MGETGKPEPKKREDMGQLERKVFDFFTLSQLGKSLISIQDMENLARVFASAVYETSDAKNVALLIHDIEKNAFTYHYSIGLDVDKVKDVAFVEGAALLAERIRSEVESYEYPGLKGEKLKVTISLGIGCYPVHAEEVEGLIEMADIALYACKAAGRNCFRVYEAGMKKEKPSPVHE